MTDLSSAEPGTGADRAELADYVAGWRERARRESEAACAWREEVLERLPAVAHLLRTEFGATRVLLFGSLSRGMGRPGSDVDLLVDGLGMADLIRATVAVERLLPGVDADLVPTASARQEVRARAEREGRVIDGV